MNAGYTVPTQGGVGNVYKWIPNSGALVVSLGGSRAIGSIYMSLVDTPIAFSASPTPENGNPFYTAHPPSGQNNPQVINVPEGSTAVTLTASSSGTHYVFAYSGNFRPSMEGPAA